MRVSGEKGVSHACWRQDAKLTVESERPNSVSDHVSRTPTGRVAGSNSVPPRNLLEIDAAHMLTSNLTDPACGSFVYIDKCILCPTQRRSR